MGWTILFAGLCIGSFFNVVIYRWPRGLSVNEPKRSFCPECGKTLPIWQNIPVVTWLIQLGKCRSCGTKIPVRYLWVEVVTGGLFFYAWWALPMWSAILAIALFSILVVVTFIDAEHQLIPISWTSAGVVLALAGSLISPLLLDLGQMTYLPGGDGWQGLLEMALGWVAGFGSLWLMIHLGKLFFGRKKMQFDQGAEWKLAEGFEGSDQLHFLIDGEGYSWDDLFFRSTDELLIEGEGVVLDGKKKSAKKVLIKRDYVEVGDHRSSIEELKALRGIANRVVVPREAMGNGDPHLLGMIGAFLGWPAVLFVIFGSSILGILAAGATRTGFGKPLPFGPMLAAAAVGWVMGGWKLWIWYFENLRTFHS